MRTLTWKQKAAQSAQSSRDHDRPAQFRDRQAFLRDEVADLANLETEIAGDRLGTPQKVGIVLALCDPDASTRQQRAEILENAH